MSLSSPKIRARLQRVAKNLSHGMELAWAASPSALVGYSVLGMINATMTPIMVYLGARLVNVLAHAHAQALGFDAVLPIILGLWLTNGVQRAIGAYMGYGRTL